MNKESKIEPDFTDISNELKESFKNKPSNFFKNPEKHWGPKRAATIVVESYKKTYG